MASLKEMALSYQGKKDIADLEKIPIDIEVKTDTFTNKDKQVVPFNYIEMNGWKYTIKGKMLEELQNLAKANPNAKFFRFKKASNGELFAIPLD